ncbi:MAG: HK97 gp10 family phage protein [Candidatus Paceibacterota bacterium]|jgi:hypothetical protein
MQNQGKVEGLEEFERTLNEFARVMGIDALREAEDAAANAVVRVIQSNTPRQSGDLANAIEIVESTDRRALSKGARRRLLVGPNKKMGFHGFWVDQGWKHPKGPRQVKSTRRGRQFTTGRLARANGRAHSQQGVSGYVKVRARYWFTKLAPQMQSAARTAGTRVLQSYAKKFTA